jgi:hypothetical protein
MAEIVQSLFGVSPEMYQRQQQDRADAQALRFAQLDPFQQANFAIGRGANMLGGAIGGALGGQDPELQRISMRQQIASQIDFTDPASIQQGMNALGDDVMGKQQLAQIYRQQQESGALIAQRNRESRQPVPADIQVANEISALQETVGQLQDAPASPERDRNLRVASGRLSELQRLTAKPGEKPPAANVKEVGVSVSTKLPVYFDVNTSEQFTVATGPDGKPIRKPYVGGVDRTTAKTEVGVKLPEQEKAFETELGKGQAKNVLDDRSAAQDAAEILRTNQVGRDLLKSGAITGTGANLFVGLNNALAQAGLDFGYADAAANSQAYVAAMGANVGRIIKQFGAGTGLSNADREYAAKIAAGEIALTETALRRILDINDRAANRAIDLHNRNVKSIKTNIPLTVEKPVFDKPKPSAAGQIPGQNPAPVTATPSQAAIDALKAGRGTDAQFDALFGPGAANRAKGVK